MKQSLASGRSFLRRQPQWPDPHHSIGLWLGKTDKGRKSCWLAKGSAEEAFEKISPKILDTLTCSSMQVPSDEVVTFDIFMIGETVDAAVPCIMFACEDKKTRKAAFETIKKSKLVVEHHPAIQVGHWKWPPQQANLQPLAFLTVTCSKSGTTDGWPYLTPIPGRNTSAAMKFVLPQQSETQQERTATVGCQYFHGTHQYVLLPKHVFGEQNHKETAGSAVNQTNDSNEDSDDDDDCEFSGFNTVDELSDSEIEITRQFSISPQPSLSGTSDDQASIRTSGSSGDDPPVTDYEAEDEAASPPLPLSRTLSPDSQSSSHTEEQNEKFLAHSDELDYALVEEIGYCWPFLPELRDNSVAKIPRGEVSIETITASNGPITGKLFGRTSHARLPGNKTFSQVYLCQLYAPLELGDSGSIVKNAKNGKIYGHIVLGTPCSQWAYVVPATEVLDDIRRQLPIADLAVTEVLEEIDRQFPVVDPEVTEGPPFERPVRPYDPASRVRTSSLSPSRRPSDAATAASELPSGLTLNKTDPSNQKRATPSNIRLEGQGIDAIPASAFELVDGLKHYEDSMILHWLAILRGRSTEMQTPTGFPHFTAAQRLSSVSSTSRSSRVSSLFSAPNARNSTASSSTRYSQDSSWQAPTSVGLMPPPSDTFHLHKPLGTSDYPFPPQMPPSFVNPLTKSTDDFYSYLDNPDWQDLVKEQSGYAGPATESNVMPQRRNHSTSYYCTSCDQTFQRKWDWKRHEEEFHERSRKWVCPDCNRPDFFSENSFKKHHERSHKCKRCPHAAKVEVPVEQRIAWGCGICKALLNSWDERMDHIATHYEEGKTKKDYIYSAVVYALLHQDDIISKWRTFVALRHGREGVSFSWDKKIIKDALRGLEYQRDPADIDDLVKTAYELGIRVPRQLQRKSHPPPLPPPKDLDPKERVMPSPLSPSFAMPLQKESVDTKGKGPRDRSQSWTILQRTGQ